MRICVTGAEGLIGSALCGVFERGGHEVRRLDIAAAADSPHHGDLRDAVRVARAVDGCDGVVHLGAVSRVVWGERDPARCAATNEAGTRHVVEAAASARSKPWVLFSSSREVYGEPRRLPAREDDAIAPVNVYGRSKAAGERHMFGARAHGVRTAVLRFSNVYGSTRDHVDRVVPAFCRGAARGEALCVEGGLRAFDFTHLDDTLAGVLKTVELLAGGERNLPPVHLTSGRPTTLGQLAVMAAAAGGWRSEIREAPSRNFDVAHFWGDPARARELLGWRAARALEDGVAELVRDFASAPRS